MHEFVRYTGLPICATPCDNIDDMCENFADEVQYCHVFDNWSTRLLILIFIATVASAVVVIGTRVAYHNKYRDCVHITPAISSGI